MNCKKTLIIISMIILGFKALMPTIVNAAELMTKEEIMALLASKHSLSVSRSSELEAMYLMRMQAADQEKGLAVFGEASSTMIEFKPAEFLNGPNPSELGYVVTRRLFGGPANTALSYLRDDFTSGEDDGASATALTIMIGMMSYVGMTLAAMFAMYTLIGGILSSGRDGEFLGRNWDSMFVPVRTALAAMGTFPIPAFGGLSFIQMMTLILFLIGMGAGSAMFATLAPALMSKPIIAAQFPPDKVAEIADTIAEMQLCGMTYYHELGQPLPPQRWRITQNHTSNRVTYLFHYNMPERATCGHVEVNYDPRLSDDPTNRWGRIRSASFTATDAFSSDTLSAWLGSNHGHIERYVNQQMRQYAITVAVPNLFEKIEPLTLFSWHSEMFAAEHVEAKSGSTPGGLNEVAGTLYWQALDGFELDMNRGVEVVVSGSSWLSHSDAEFASMVRDQGMMFGGAYYYLISRRQNLIGQALEDSIPSVRRLDQSSLQSSNVFSRMVTSLMSIIRGTARGGERNRMIDGKITFDQIVANGPNFGSNYSKAIREYNASVSSDMVPFLGAANRSIAEAMTGLARIGESSSSVNPDPLLEMQSMGTKILQSLFVLTALSDTPLGRKAGILSKTAKIGTAAKGSNTGKLIGTVMAVAIGGLMAVAFLYSTIIPSLPFVVFTISALGLFIFVIKAMVAAPLFWAMQAHPEGNDLIGKSGAGYPMLLALLLRPILMVVGLIAAMAVIRVSAYVINVVLFPTIEVMNTGFTNPIGMMNYFVLYGVMMLVITYKNVGLIYELPQVVLSFIGVGNSYTDFGEKEAQFKVAGLGMYGSKLIGGKN